MLYVLIFAFVVRTLRNDMQSLYDTDEMDKWREKEGKELGELVQKRLHYIQVLHI